MAPRRQQPLSISAEPLTRSAFRPFGTAVQNPQPGVHPSAFHPEPSSSPSPSPSSPSPTTSSSPPGLPANQGSAIKYPAISPLESHYPSAPSLSPAAPALSLFVCAARARPGTAFRPRVLERHPFTTQTFVPLGADPTARYLVVVAPDQPLPLPLPLASAPGGQGMGMGMGREGGETTGLHRPRPDVARLRAFVASAAQAVTYAAGTWHAPMVVLGEDGAVVEFVVVQFANGVGEEDCQEVEIGGEVEVRVPAWSALGEKAKL